MTTTLPAQITPIEIDWYADHEIVSVNPRDQQRFDIQKDKAIDVLRVAAQQEKLFDKQMSLLMRRLGEWIRTQQNKIENAFLTLHDGSMAFVVVKSKARLDEQLEDSLSELDVAIANDAELDLIDLNTVALPPAPPESLMSFLDTRFLVSYDGKRSRAHTTGKQKPRLSNAPPKGRRSIP